MKNLWWIIGGAAALFFLTRGKLARSIEFFLSKVRARGNVLSPEIVADIVIQNPTTQRATLRSITGQLLVNGNFVAQIAFFGNTRIQPVGETLVSITARPFLPSSFRALIDILTSPTGQNVISIKGNANIDGITYPVNVQTTI